MVSPTRASRVQGLGRVYHTGRKAPVWGHLFLSLTLVYPHGDPYPLALKPFPTPGMETSSTQRRPPPRPCWTRSLTSWPWNPA